MGLTMTRQDLWGNTRVVFADHTFGVSYAVGGEAADPGLRIIEQVLIGQGVAGLVFEYDIPNRKLKAIHPTGGVAQAGLADPSTAVPAGATAVTSTAAQPNLTETAGVGKEVGAAANLSTVTAKLVFLGQ